MVTGKLSHLGYTVAYNLIRLSGKFSKSGSKGAGVAVWHGGQILAVRHSYRPGWSLPGGRAKRNELPSETASREVKEEVGIDLPSEDLEFIYESRTGNILFAYDLPSPLEPQIDNREIVEAKFLDPVEITDPDWSLYYYLKYFRGIPLRFSG